MTDIINQPEFESNETDHEEQISLDQENIDESDLQGLLDEHTNLGRKLEKAFEYFNHLSEQRSHELEICETEKLATQTNLNNTIIKLNNCTAIKNRANKDKNKFEKNFNTCNTEKNNFKLDLTNCTSSNQKTSDTLNQANSDKDSCLREKTSLESTIFQLETAKNTSELSLFNCTWQLEEANNHILAQTQVIESYKKPIVNLDDPISGRVKCLQHFPNIDDYSTIDFNNNNKKKIQTASSFKDLCVKTNGTPDLVVCFIGNNSYDLTEICFNNQDIG